MHAWVGCSEFLGLFCMYKYTYIQIYMCIYIYVCVCVYTYVYMNIYIHVYIHTYVNKYQERVHVYYYILSQIQVQYTHLHKWPTCTYKIFHMLCWWWGRIIASPWTRECHQNKSGLPVYWYILTYIHLLYIHAFKCTYVHIQDLACSLSMMRTDHCVPADARVSLK